MGLSMKEHRQMLCCFCLNAETDERGFPCLEGLLQRTPPDKRHELLNVCGKGELTPLFHAIGGESGRAVKALLDAGADPNVGDHKGFTPLFTSVGDCGNTETTRVLLEYGADPNYVEEKDHISAMLIASKYHRLDAIKLLFQYNSNPRIRSKDKLTALTAAGNDKETRKLLLEMTRSLDIKEEKKSAVCDNCKCTLKKLKRCGKCFGKLYCSKECQLKDWKEGHKLDCKGFAVAKVLPRGCLCGLDDDYMGTVDLYDITPKVFVEMTSHHVGKQFIVKVQPPLPGSHDTNMLVYCEDQCCIYFLQRHHDKEAYSDIEDLIETSGVLGRKGYFWAEIHDSLERAVKIFHTKLAPTQNW